MVVPQVDKNNASMKIQRNPTTITKIISGNASALGGCAVFRGINEGEDKFKLPRYSFLTKFIKGAGKMALIPNAKKRAMRDFGMSANANASYLTMLGLETLPLRLSRIIESIETITCELDKAGLKINHPSLKSHPQNERYTTQFKNGCGTLFTIDMQSKEAAFRFLNKTKIATLTANIGDSRTLALHMASTIYRDFDEKTKEFLGITDGLIRVSIGLENPEDIMNTIPDNMLYQVHLNDFWINTDPQGAGKGKPPFKFHPPLQYEIGYLKKSNLVKLAEYFRNKGVEVVVVGTEI